MDFCNYHDRTEAAGSLFYSSLTGSTERFPISSTLSSVTLFIVFIIITIIAVSVTVISTSWRIPSRSSWLVVILSCPPKENTRARMTAAFQVDPGLSEAVQLWGWTQGHEQG